jgi:trigger factor
MKVNVEQAGPCRKVVNIQIPSETVAAEYQKVAGEFAKVAKIAGFRPGRAPQAIVERKFTKEILEETRERLVPQAYRSALDQEHIQPVAIVDVGDVRLEKNLPLTFKVTVDVDPVFALPTYKGVTLKSKKPEVSDAEVDRVVGELRERQARFEDVTGRSARKGDIVQVDYAGTCDGRPVAEVAPERAELGHGRDFWVLLDNPEFLPGIAAGVEGAGVGEQRAIAVEFPPDYAVKPLAGKKADYAVTVKAIRERRLPETDAEFFKAVGVESLDDLRAKVRENLLKSAELAEKSRLKDEILRWLVVQVDLQDLPQTLVDEEARHIIQDVVQENTRRGVPKEQIEAHRDDIFSKAAQSSADRVRIGYLLDRIAEEEKIGVDDADLDQELERMSARYGMDKPRFRAALEQRGALASVRRNLRMDKTLNFLLDAAVVEAA